MRNAVVCWEEGVRKYFSGVGAGEDTGFRCGVEDLAQGVAVDREIVDGFMGNRGFAGSEGGLREHAHDSSSIGTSEWFALIGYQ